MISIDFLRLASIRYASFLHSYVIITLRKTCRKHVEDNSTFPTDRYHGQTNLEKKNTLLSNLMSGFLNIFGYTGALNFTEIYLCGTLRKSPNFSCNKCLFKWLDFLAFLRNVDPNFSSSLVCI